MTRKRILTTEQVHALRSAHKPGVRGAGYESLARQFGVAVSTVRDVVTYRTYGNITIKG